MHIILANQWYPPESGWGGVAMWNYAMAHAYRELGHQVTVLASRQDDTTASEQEIDGIHIVRLLYKDAYRLRRVPALGRYVRPAQQIIHAWHVNQALKTLYDAEPFDVVEFAEVNAEGFFYARAPLTPVVVRCHTPTFVLKRYYEPREMPFDTRIISWCERDLIHRAHALTAPSHDMANIIADECHLPRENISVIPNALPLDEFQIADFIPKGLYRCGYLRPAVGLQIEPAPITESPNHPITILQVGRLERVKGAPILVDAIPQIARAIPLACFVFVGEDRRTARSNSQRAELEAQLEAAGLRASVEFLGEVDQSTLVQCYRRADICVVPSLLYESFSYTSAQAMAAGKPVVATRSGGIPETVEDGVTGLIVEPGDTVALSTAIIRLAREPQTRRKMGEAGCQKAQTDFDPLKVATQNLEVYRQAIKAHRHVNA